MNQIHVFHYAFHNLQPTNVLLSKDVFVFTMKQQGAHTCFGILSSGKTPIKPGIFFPFLSNSSVYMGTNNWTVFRYLNL